MTNPLFEHIQLDCPNGLAEKIVQTIEHRKMVNYYAKIIIFGFFSLVSVFVLVIALRSEIPYIINSEAGKLVSLLFSDSSIILKYWQQYFLSLIQSLPIVSIIIVGISLWLVCMFVWMMARASLVLIHHNKIKNHA
ncbi:MAG: hypothetical protein WC526_03445 [Patescibacteria group bacterium]